MEDLNYLNEEVETDEISGMDITDNEMEEMMDGLETEFEHIIGIHVHTPNILIMDHENLDDIPF